MGKAMAFDPLSLALSFAGSAVDLGIGNVKAKKAKKTQIKNEYLQEQDYLSKETASFLNESRVRTMAGGVSERTLTPTLNQMLKTNLEDLRKRKERELKAL